MIILAYIIISTFIVSLVSFVGISLLVYKSLLIDKILLYLISLSAGTMMGGVFLHLIPEAVNSADNISIIKYVLISFIFFLFLEHFINWHHCAYNSKKVSNKKSVGYLNLSADFVHNFIDGLIIAGSFVFDIKLGIVTSIAIAFHEIPQEIGDMGVLLHSGFSKSKALVLNFLTALSAVLGGIIGFYISDNSTSILPYLLCFAAGGFLYIGASDLIPEIRGHKQIKLTLFSSLFFLSGVLLMILIKD